RAIQLFTATVSKSMPATVQTRAIRAAGVRSTIAQMALVWTVAGMDFETVAVNSWIALIYLGAISMFLASVFWYRGLAAGGVARIGQINLLLPLVALGWSALFLGEEITPTAIVCTLVVFAAMIVCLKSRTNRRPA
ncbi:MAG: DMT family transporter, partial [Pseudomonadota bacterium]